MTKDYSKFSREELIKYIEKLQAQLKSEKYGLYWDIENSKEDLIFDCYNNIPLFSINKKTLINGNVNNLLIEGDNYFSLISLNYIMKNRIDFIYIDPPYNTGHDDFVYNDHYIDEDDGYRHSKWLSMMKKRLLLSRELLNEDGVIFISIDDNEQANLKLLCDSIFGSSNFITQFLWEKTQHFGRQKVNYYSNCEYILCYAKKLFSGNLGRLKELLVEKIKNELTDAPLYNASNKINKLVFKKGKVKFNLSDGEYTNTTNPTYNLLKPVIVKNGLNLNDLVLEFKSRWSQQTIDEEIEKGTTFWVKSDGFAIRVIYHEGKTAKESPKQLIFTNSNNPLCAYTRYGNKVGVNEEGSNELAKIINQSIFSYPKPVTLIKYLLSLYYDYSREIHKKDFVVLDFFAGSGTTGQAVLELNKEDGGNRRFILCTNNENNICTDVTYPRLKTVITGIRPDGTKYSDGIPANLIYYKTDFIKDSNNTDQAKYCLVEKVDELLCISEDIFIQLERNDYSSHYVSNDKTRHMFIYSDYYNEIKFKEFKQRVLNASGTKVVYIFSSDNNVDETLFEGTKDIEVKPIPSKIYEIYKEIVEDIKRGQ